VILVVLVVFLVRWFTYRLRHSITDDAFVEAHIVNVAPEVVSGHIVRMLVEENDRVVAGQVLAEIDPVPYQDRVDIARSKLDAAQAELRRQQAALDRLRIEVPIQIEIAKRTFAAAMADEARAKDSLQLTEDETEKGVEEAEAALEAAEADLLLAQQEHDRYTKLQKENAVPLHRAQEVIRTRDAAEAHRKLAAAKLAKAKADRVRVEVAKKTLEAAEKTTEKAVKGVDLAETGNAQIREVELLTAVKNEGVHEAESTLEAAVNDLAYTKLLAPFDGIVVKRYRHLGDFISSGVALVSMYNPDLTYVEANLEETRLTGVAPGNAVELEVDAFDKPFQGRVVWINRSTGAQVALMPRNVVSGEFTKVVQRVPVRIVFEKDDRWDQLRAGLSVCVSIAHGPGDSEWAAKAAREFAQAEARFNRPAPETPPKTTDVGGAALDDHFHSPRPRLVVDGK
jgi:membrane fusion protein, multidrug efflux system